LVNAADAIGDNGGKISVDQSLISFTLWMAQIKLPSALKDMTLWTTK